MAKLLRAHLAIPLAVSLTLFAQLFFVHARSPQFPTLAPTMNRPGIVVAMVVRLYLDASRPNHTLCENADVGRAKRAALARMSANFLTANLLYFVTRNNRSDDKGFPLHQWVILPTRTPTTSSLPDPERPFASWSMNVAPDCRTSAERDSCAIRRPVGPMAANCANATPYPPESRR